MKSLKLISLVVFILLYGWASGQAKKFTIDGLAPELKSGAMVLTVESVAGMDTLAVALVTEGHFAMEGEIAAPCVALLKAAEYDGGFRFILEPDVPYAMKLYRTGQPEIRGGRLQEEFVAYSHVVQETNRKIGELKKELAAAIAAKHFKTAAALEEERVALLQLARKELKERIRRNRDNVVAAYILTAGTARMDLPALKRCYGRLSEQAQMTGPGTLLAARIARLEELEKDAVAPEFVLRTPEGAGVSMHAVKGKLKIIDFWASWCGPCRLENPNMVALYRDFRERGLAVIGVSLDDRYEAWTAAIRKDSLTWVQVSDLRGWQGEVVKQYNIESIPAIFILDENNRVLARQLRGDALRTFVRERLGEGQ